MTDTPLSLAPAASLPVRFVIYLPAAPEGSQVAASDIEAAVVRILCERFGGVTAYPAKGTFTLASGVAQTEPVTVLETYCERETWQRDSSGVAAMAGILAKLLDQEALGCSVDGKMILIEADKAEAREKPNDVSRPPDLYTQLTRAFG
jgi:hypothetical protein